MDGMNKKDIPQVIPQPPVWSHHDPLPFLTTDNEDIMSNETNTEIIKKMIQNLRSSVTSSRSRFDPDWFDNARFKKEIDVMLSSWQSNGVITESINKTGFPDDVILTIIESNIGYKIDSIETFKTITATWKDTPTSVGYVFNYTLMDQCEMVSFNIEVGERGLDQCE